MDDSSASSPSSSSPPGRPAAARDVRERAVDLMLQRESRAEEEVVWKRDHGVRQVRR